MILSAFERVRQDGEQDVIQSPNPSLRCLRNQTGGDVARSLERAIWALAFLLIKGPILLAIEPRG